MRDWRYRRGVDVMFKIVDPTQPDSSFLREIDVTLRARDMEEK